MSFSENRIRISVATVSEQRGVVEVRFDDDARIDAAIMEEVLEAQRQLGANLVLVDSRPVATMSRAAQELSAKNGVEGTRRVAILIENPVSVVLGNFFIRLNSPPYETRLFRDEARAQAWLRELLEED
jgi:hypothetical protein